MGYSLSTNLIALLIVIVIIIVFILIIREVVCWYFKINKMVGFLESIDNRLANMNFPATHAASTTGVSFGDINKKCKKCGTDNNVNAIECSKCGERL